VKLSAEAQQIDRMLEAFSARYAEENAEWAPEAAYAVAFSVLMLQTDLHNVRVVRKISADEWIANTSTGGRSGSR
jgi:Sec7-like guanine-nucleotide exchange factor